jgi:hypothetical protein
MLIIACCLANMVMTYMPERMSTYLQQQFVEQFFSISNRHLPLYVCVWLIMQKIVLDKEGM